jgi:hypothetical protein
MTANRFSPRFDFSHFPDTFNAEVLDNQSYTETSSADMASNKINPTPSRSNTARRRALTLPPPPHERHAVHTPRHGTDTNEKPDPRFSFLPNTVDVLSFPTEPTYNMLNPQSQSNAELNNQDPGADDVEYDSHYTGGEPAHYSESESQSNIGGYNNASEAPVLSNFDGPFQLEVMPLPHDANSWRCRLGRINAGVNFFARRFRLGTFWSGLRSWFMGSLTSR